MSRPAADAPLRVLIVDDEAPARTKLRTMLEGDGAVEIVGEARDGTEAVAAIRRQQPDLVFLDVQMPKLDGFGVIQAIGAEAMPLVVFVTAYDEHALRAFEVSAFDYLLKPFAPTRFRRALERARARLRERGQGEMAGWLKEVLGSLAKGQRHLQRVLVTRSEGREVLLAVERIDLIRAEGNYLRFFSGREQYVRRGSLTALVDRLDPDRFLRINRSEIVRLDAVAEFQPWFHGDYHVVMSDGQTLTLSRRFRTRAIDRV